MPHPSVVRREKGLVRHTAHQALHVDAVRFAVAAVRYAWFTRVRRALRQADVGDAVAADTIGHNLAGMRDLAVARSLFIARPLSTIEWLPVDADILIIGPRTEGELLAYMAHGFLRSHVRALDLITYSPWIDLGDMHDLPYGDDSFDVVVFGWVLAYSNDRPRAVTEALRVLRPGGIVAVGVEWNARSNEDFVEELGYLPGSVDRVDSCDEILELFGSHVDQVIVRQDNRSTPRSDAGQMIVIFTTPG
jgi:SAM-dependent methyltransferase